MMNNMKLFCIVAFVNDFVNKTLMLCEYKSLDNIKIQLYKTNVFCTKCENDLTTMCKIKMIEEIEG